MPVGRPKIQIDYNTVEKLANIQCTQEEIASFFKFHHIYKYNRFNRCSLWNFRSNYKFNISIIY